MIINGFGGSSVTQSFGNGDILMNQNFTAQFSGSGLTMNIQGNAVSLNNNPSGFPTIPLLDYFSKYNSLFFQLKLNVAQVPSLTLSAQCKNSTNRKFSASLRFSIYPSKLLNRWSTSDTSSNAGAYTRAWGCGNNTTTHTQSSSSFSYITINCSWSEGFVYSTGSQYLDNYYPDEGGAGWMYKMGPANGSYGTDLIKNFNTNGIAVINGEDSGTAGRDLQQEVFTSNAISFNQIINFSTTFQGGELSLHGNGTYGGYGHDTNSSSYWGTAQSYTLKIPCTAIIRGYH